MSADHSSDGGLGFLRVKKKLEEEEEAEEEEEEEKEEEGEEEEREGEEGRRRRRGIREKKNKYRGGTSDATTSWSLIVSFDYLLPSKMAVFVVQK